MRLRLVPNGHVPDSDRYYYLIQVQEGPEESCRYANDEEFRQMLNILPQIRTMAERVFGSDFVVVRPETMDLLCLDLLLKKGVPTRRRQGFLDFKGWLALFSEEPGRDTLSPEEEAVNALVDEVVGGLLREHDSGQQ